MKKRALSILLALIMFTGLFGLTTHAQGEEAALRADMFERPSSIFHPDIAKAAANIIEGNHLGVAFSKPYAGGTYLDVDNPAFTIGTKQLGAATLIVAELLGTSEPAQYLVNNAVGYVGFLDSKRAYRGFLVQAGYISFAESVCSALLEAIGKAGGKNIKVLLTGHSMGGAGASLAGLKLAEAKGTDNKPLIETDDIFVYTFESPGVYFDHTFGLQDNGKQYKNIFNFVNTADTIIGVTPGTRFGTTFEFTRYPKNNDTHHPSYEDYARVIDDAAKQLAETGGYTGPNRIEKFFSRIGGAFYDIYISLYKAMK